LYRDKEHKTAILIFANSAEEDGKQKHICKSELLFSELNQQTLLKVKKTKLPYFQITQEKQSGHSFGERFVNAIEQIYTLGFENVIAIGNDSPQLKVKHLLKASNNITADKTVVGPTFDGGFYLLGLHRSNFNAALFERLPWKRLNLFTQLSSLFEAKQTDLLQLETLHDIDATDDIVKILNYTKSISKTFLQFLTSFLQKTTTVLELKHTAYERVYSKLFFNKGSPFCLSL